MNSPSDGSSQTLPLASSTRGEGQPNATPSGHGGGGGGADGGGMLIHPPPPAGKQSTTRKHVKFAPNIKIPPPSAVYFPSSSSPPGRRGGAATIGGKRRINAYCALLMPGILLLFILAAYGLFNFGNDVAGGGKGSAGADGERRRRDTSTSSQYQSNASPSDRLEEDNAHQQQRDHSEQQEEAFGLKDDRRSSSLALSWDREPLSACSSVASITAVGTKTERCLTETLQRSDALAKAQYGSATLADNNSNNHKKQERTRNPPINAILFKDPPTSKKEADRRPSSPFITGDGFRASCDLIYDEVTANSVREAVKRAFSPSPSSDNKRSSLSPSSMAAERRARVVSTLRKKTSTLLKQKRAVDGSADKKNADDTHPITRITTQLFVGEALPKTSLSSSMSSARSSGQKEEGNPLKAVGDAHTLDLHALLKGGGDSNLDGGGGEKADILLPMFMSEVFEGLWQRPKEMEAADARGEKRLRAGGNAEGSSSSLLSSFLNAFYESESEENDSNPNAAENGLVSSSPSFIPTVFVQTHFIDKFITDVLTPLATAMIKMEITGGTSASAKEVVYLPFLRSQRELLPTSSSASSSSSSSPFPTFGVGFTLVTHNSDYSAPWEPKNTRMKNGVIGEYTHQRHALLDADGDADEEEGAAMRAVSLPQKTKRGGGGVEGGGGAERDLYSSLVVPSSSSSLVYSFLPRALRCLRWYAQNVVVSHPRLFPIPIGIENRYNKYGAIVKEGYAAVADEKVLGPLLKRQHEQQQRSKKLFVSFSVKTNPKQRGQALTAAKQMDEKYVTLFKGGAIKGSKQHNYKETLTSFLSELASHQFVLAPHGHGLDTHRLWEALYMGCVPITHAAPLGMERHGGGGGQRQHHDSDGDGDKGDRKALDRFKEEKRGGGDGMMAIIQGAGVPSHLLGGDVGRHRVDGFGIGAAMDVRLLSQLPVVVMPRFVAEAGHDKSAVPIFYLNNSFFESLNYEAIMSGAWKRRSRKEKKGSASMESYFSGGLGRFGEGDKEEDSGQSMANQYPFLVLDGILNMKWWEREVRHWHRRSGGRQ